MYKILKCLLICLVITVLCCFWNILSVRKELSKELIRFHVVANSDEEKDQEIKLQVRDAIIKDIQKDLEKIKDINTAREYLEANLPRIQIIANNMLDKLGADQRAVASFCRETFDVRHYETFSLPAGVYDSLKIVIGEGEGHNWWCVTFPSLCIPATTDGFESVAADAGLSPEVVGMLSHKNDHRIKFYLLEQIGHIQNLVFSMK